MFLIVSYKCLTLDSRCWFDSRICCGCSNNHKHFQRLDICILKSQRSPVVFSTMTFHLKVSTRLQARTHAKIPRKEKSPSHSKHLLEDPCQILTNHLPMSHLNRWWSQYYWRRWCSAICSCKLNMLSQILWQGCCLCPFQAHRRSGLWIREKWRCCRRHVSSNWRVATTLSLHWFASFWTKGLREIK